MHYSIEFEVPAHPQDEFVFPQPKFKFMDKVALVHSGESPDSWEIAEVTGMVLQFSRWKDSGELIEQPVWLYNIQQPGHCTNPIWLEERELVSASDVPDIKAGDDLIESLVDS